MGSSWQNNFAFECNHLRDNFIMSHLGVLYGMELSKMKMFIPIKPTLSLIAALKAYSWLQRFGVKERFEITIQSMQCVLLCECHNSVVMLPHGWCSI